MKKGAPAGKVEIVSQAVHNLKSRAGVIHAGPLNALLEDIDTPGKKGAVTKKTGFPGRLCCRSIFQNRKGITGIYEKAKVNK
jgi:hypothetical protein